jgi:rare lipoprotein A
MTSDDDVRPTARSRRAARAEAREERRSRSSRVTTTSFSGGGSSGIASYYWQPQRVASGGMFNPNAMTAAHKTLPFGKRVRVTNHNTGRSAVVTINDRGPFVRGRVIDLSRAAASSVGMIGSGLARVTLEVLGR